MKKILIPFDFTDASQNAMLYAFDMFVEDSESTILHVLGGNLSANDPYIVNMGLTMSNGIEESIRDIVQERIGNRNGAGSPNFEILVKYGAIVDAITEVSRKGAYDGIVMGKRDNYKLLDKIFGTIALGVIKRAVAPIFVIPMDAKYKPFAKVVVAADHHLESDKVLEALASWNTQYLADMHFLHVKQKEVFDDEFIRNIVEEFFDKKHVEFPFSIIEEPDKEIAQKLIDYGTKENADLHIIISDMTTWLDSITSKKVSKEMILKSNKPLMVLHSGLRKYTEIFFNLMTV